MRFADSTVDNVADLISTLRTHRQQKPAETLWFRGQDRIEWCLEPSIKRGVDEPVKREYELLKRFRQMAPRYVDSPPVNEWEWIFLMQHYGVPTRLLDWSESPIVALYFAIHSIEHAAHDGALWIVSPATLNMNTGWGHLQDRGGIPFFGMEAELDNYLTSNVVNAKATSGSGPIAAVAPRTSARIAAQHGVFTAFHADFTPIESIGDADHCWRYRIPAASKVRLKEELSTLQVNEFALFPELDKISGIIKG